MERFTVTLMEAQAKWVSHKQYKSKSWVREQWVNNKGRKLRGSKVSPKQWCVLVKDSEGDE